MLLKFMTLLKIQPLIIGYLPSETYHTIGRNITAVVGDMMRVLSPVCFCLPWERVLHAETQKGNERGIYIYIYRVPVSGAAIAPTKNKKQKHSHKITTNKMAMQRMKTGSRLHEAHHMRGIGQNDPLRGSSQLPDVLSRCYFDSHADIVFLKPATFLRRGFLRHDSRIDTEHAIHTHTDACRLGLSAEFVGELFSACCARSVGINAHSLCFHTVRSRRFSSCQ